MRIEVLYFAVLRERIHRGGETLDIALDSDVGTARVAIAARHPEIAPLLPLVRTAVNRKMADENQLLSEGDELALIPPVAGGSGVIGDLRSPTREACHDDE